MPKSPVDKVQKTSSRPQRENIKGLPEHAQIQRQGKTWYVYFPYCFSANGKREQERDYIGTLSPDGSEFRPNLYYEQNEPVFEERPVDRWKNPINEKSWLLSGITALDGKKLRSTNGRRRDCRTR